MRNARALTLASSTTHGCFDSARSEEGQPAILRASAGVSRVSAASVEEDELLRRSDLPSELCDIERSG